MIPSQYGFLLLTSRLGSATRRPLTTAQMRTLTDRISSRLPQIDDRDLVPSDLTKLGYDKEMAEYIVSLLEDTALLDMYLKAGERTGCYCVTRSDPRYPLTVRRRLGLDSPGCFWMKGDADILKEPAVSLVGNRNLHEKNREFAAEVGAQAAKQGIVLVSGNARGADNAAQEACLQAGGKVVCVVADSLQEHAETENVLFISEESFEEPFSKLRALSRNRVIHAMGVLSFVAQCSEEKGGTWDGTVRNLKSRWSPVFCLDDGSAASLRLEALGASLIDKEGLADLPMLASESLNLLEKPVE